MKAGKFLLCFILIIFFSTILYAQSERNNWFFGDSIVLNFNNGSPFHDSICLLWRSEIGCSISNSNGNVKFFAGFTISNPPYEAYVFNADRNFMPNGYGIYCNMNAAQNLIIVPFPDDTNKFYLFSIGFLVQMNYQKLFFSVINLTEDSGRGDVTVKNQLINDSLVANPLYAIKHGNGRDWWVIYHDLNFSSQNRFYKLLITPSGISGPYIQNIGRAQVQTNWGPLIANPTGDKIIFGGLYRLLDLFSFDRCTGLLYDYIPLGDSTITYYDSYRGCSFSPDGTKLYASTYDSLFQFNLNATNIKASQTLIATTPVDPHTYINQHQLGPDGKIFLTNVSTPFFDDSLSTYLGVIHSPDSSGIACNYNMYDFSLNSHKASGLPNLPMYHLGRLHGSLCDTLQWAALEDTHFDNTFYIYPNPSNDFLTIKTKTGKPLTVAIYDVLSKEKLSTVIKGDARIDIGELSQGVYFYRVYDGEKILKGGKFLKQ